MGSTFFTSHSSTGIYHICEQGASSCIILHCGALQIRLMPQVFRLALLGQRLSCKALPTDAWAEHGDFQSFPTATCGLVKQLAPNFPPSSATASSSALSEDYSENFQPPGRPFSQVVAGSEQLRSVDSEGVHWCEHEDCKPSSRRRRNAMLLWTPQNQVQQQKMQTSWFFGKSDALDACIW